MIGTISVVCGIASAALWLAAAAVPMPRRIWIYARTGGGSSEDAEALVSRLRLQSKLNGAAAIFAAGSVLTQIITR